MTKQQTRRSKKGWIAFVLMLGLGFATFQSPVFWQWLITSSVQTIEDKTGWQIVTSRVVIKPFNGTLRLEDTAVHGTDGSLIFKADAFEGNFSLLGSILERVWVFDAVEIERPMVVFRILDEELQNLKFSNKKLSPDILDEIPNIRSNEIKITEGEGTLEVIGAKPVTWTLKGAQLHLQGVDDTEHLEGDLNFDLLQWKTKDFERIYTGQAGLIELDVANLLHPEEIRLKNFEVQGDEGAVKVSGSFGFLPAWVPNYQVTVQTRLDLADFFSQAPMIAPVAGKANVELTWLGEANKPPQLRGKAFVKAFEIDGRKIGTLDIDYKGDLKDIDITDGKLTAGGTTLNLFGSMHLKHPFTFSLDVVADRVSLYQVLDDLGVRRPWVELFASIHVFGEGKLLPQFSFDGQSTGTLTDFFVYGQDARKVGDK